MSRCDMNRTKKTQLKHKKVVTTYKKKGKVSIQDSVAVIRFVNMSGYPMDSQTQKSTSKYSHIKFSASSFSRNRTSGFPSLNFYDQENLSLKPSLSSGISQDTIDLLDPTTCYHAQCSFAYNLTGDVRRDSLITECLPFNTYQKLAEFWGLNPLKTPRAFGNTCKLKNVEEEDEQVEEYIRNVEKDLGILSDVSEDLQVNLGSVKSQYRTEVKNNPYLKFLKSGGGLNITQENKSNLRKKATKINKMIIKNFLDWYQLLGRNDGETVIDEFTLQELFQVGFEFPAAKAMLIKIREMPTVPDSLAEFKNEPKHATSYGLRKFLQQDIKKENIPAKMFAFGSMLPKGRPSLRYKPPNNAVHKTWMECSRVPTELDTMERVWGGLEGLRSTIAFSNWLKDHPEVKPPTYLQEKGLLEINYEEWNLMFKGFEMEVETVDAATSESESEDEEKESLVMEEQTNSSGTKKSESLPSF